MTAGFKDHFSGVAGQYAASRPTYPAALFAWLAGQAPAQDLAWDVGAGSGQASLGLAEHFTRVLASDASAAQLGQAPAHPAITYRVAPAEESGLADASADLVTVAQALHWFDLERFYAEVRRVLRPGGVIAVWSYGILAVEGAEVDARVQHFYRHVVGPYWPPERRHVEEGYRALPFPFQPRPAADFAMRLEWTLAGLLGYLKSWSATSRYIKERGEDPIPALEAELAPLWGAKDHPRAVSFPLALRVGQV